MNDIGLITFRFLNNYYPLYVFIGTTVIIHILFVFFPKYRLTKKQWIKFDYIYYSVAILSLLSILYSAEKYFIESDKKYLVENGYHTYKSRLFALDRETHFLKSIMDRHFNKDKKALEYEKYLTYIQKTIEKLINEDENSKLRYVIENKDIRFSNIPKLNMFRIDDNNTIQKSIFVSYNVPRKTNHLIKHSYFK